MNKAIPSNKKTRVAVLGCGQIADAHFTQIARIPTAEVVAVCDVHEDLAYQAAKRFNVEKTFCSMDAMLIDCRPDVVHLTTPAHTHAALAKQLMQAGCHVYVEKPFTLDAPEARDVLETAKQTNKQICVGHDQLFDPLWLKAKAWIVNGTIGEVRHVASVLGYPIDGKFGELVAGNPNHWVRKLPGGLFQNTISHPLYRITDFMADREPRLVGGSTTRPQFGFPTELNIAFETASVTGQLTFSTHLPPQRITTIYGSKGSLICDFDAQTLRTAMIPTLPGAFAKIEMPLRNFSNSMWNLSSNSWQFLMSRIHYFNGMKTLFERFYDSIQNGTPPPIPPAEILHVTELMDRIFAHCRETESAATSPESATTQEDKSCLV